jgi:general secretion pathway protein M
MKLAKREKYIVSLGVCALAIFLLFQLLIFPFFETRERAKRGVGAREKALKEIIKLSAEYQSYNRGSQGIQQVLSQREKGFTLFSFLERAAGESQVKDRIKYMKPSVSQGTGPYKESVVELKLEEITLKQLVNYLYRIESPENVISVKRISIKENKKETGYLDAVLQVLTFQ